MPINNPAKIWLTGNEESYFTYEGGSTLYHFCPADCDIFDHWMVCNIIFFANSEEHALDVLKRMIEFMLSEPHDGVYHEHKLKSFQIILDNWDKVKVTLAPTNQVFLVSWADNDNLI